MDDQDKKKKRPVYLNLLRIRLPVAGVVSILHRVSGVLLVILLPVSLLVLQRSLAGPAEFESISRWLALTPVRLLLVLLAAACVHHFLAGLRHLLLDIDIGISGQAARLSAWLVLAGVGLAALSFGVGWLC